MSMSWRAYSSSGIDELGRIPARVFLEQARKSSHEPPDSSMSALQRGMNGVGAKWLVFFWFPLDQPLQREASNRTQPWLWLASRRQPDFGWIPAAPRLSWSLYGGLEGFKVQAELGFEQRIRKP